MAIEWRSQPPRVVPRGIKREQSTVLSRPDKQMTGVDKRTSQHLREAGTAVYSLDHTLVRLLSQLPCGLGGSLCDELAGCTSLAEAGVSVPHAGLRKVVFGGNQWRVLVSNYTVALAKEACPRSSRSTFSMMILLLKNLVFLHHRSFVLCPSRKHR